MSNTDTTATIPSREVSNRTKVYEGNLGVWVLRAGGNDYPFMTKAEAESASTMTAAQLTGFIAVSSSLSLYGEPTE